MKLRYPTNYIGITKGYKTKKYPTHSAIDLGWNASKGFGPHQSVYSPADGEVISIRDGRNNTLVPGDSGNYVTVRHVCGYETRVCHLQKGSIIVKKGDRVKQGTELALMGNSGYCGVSRGCHVHYIVWKDGSRVNPMRHTYVYPNQVVADSTKREYPNLLYYTEPKPEHNTYVRIGAKNGVWCRKGIGFSYPKYKAIPYGTECLLVKRDAGEANGYKWDEIVYAGEMVYVPNKWNTYFTKED